jgi:hypothetical protein
MPVQNGRVQNCLVTLGVLFSRLEMHSGIAMFPQFIETNSLIKMRFPDGVIDF